jgi:hypothetical protein
VIKIKKKIFYFIKRIDLENTKSTQTTSELNNYLERNNNNINNELINKSKRVREREVVIFSKYL